MEYLRSHKSSGLVTIYVGQVLFTPFISCLELGWCFCESFLTSMIINQWEAINNTDNGKLHFEIDKRQHSVIGLYLKSILLSCHLLTFSSLTLPYHSSLSYLSSALFFPSFLFLEPLQPGLPSSLAPFPSFLHTISFTSPSPSYLFSLPASDSYTPNRLPLSIYPTALYPTLEPTSFQNSSAPLRKKRKKHSIFLRFFVYLTSHDLAEGGGARGFAVWVILHINGGARLYEDDKCVDKSLLQMFWWKWNIWGALFSRFFSVFKFGFETVRLSLFFFSFSFFCAYFIS